jgi:hypothetical protein
MAIVRSDFSDFGVSGALRTHVSRTVSVGPAKDLAATQARRDDGQEHNARLLEPGPLVRL